MFFDLPYGKERISVRIPDGVHVDFLTPKEIVPLDDAEGALRQACADPIDSPPLESCVKRANNVLILVSDLTRGGGTKRILPLCVRHLKDIGLTPNRIKVLVARGTHRKLTKEEKQFFKTKDFVGITVEEHDCNDNSVMSALVLTSRKTPVRVNRSIKEAGLVLLVAPVSFHYFAGFGGGRKLILPGCSDRASILANHRLSLLDSSPVKLNPLCKPGSLEKNPIHEDMCEALAPLSGLFAINFFSDHLGNIAFINTGSPLRSHVEACDKYASLYTCSIDEPYRVVVLSPGGFPYDINLLQSHKALKHASSAVTEKGSVLFITECSEGVGSEGLEKAFDMPRNEFLKIAYKKYEGNYQTAVSLHGLMDRFRIGMVSKLDRGILDKFGFEPCENIEVFIAGALETLRATKIGLIPYGSSTLIKAQQGGRT
ncbi:MAG: nickel-dependent lactate racemase [Candidatus Latescibacteria bacterium]|nr:nickel-dependent lactate racemase [Candidatus Latescibacterota bacterium]NIM21644.1 nickel-dependent lactate racemase [Candidatus Latescibacterota bacterium]NIM64623.1 nickel-dependent lactate racemase [Candidatus Latescibacterota bacterium]NIO01138.1 nickel-dependent lactate racemase [Candidatus Latescibacterota bacterium]NIO27531.1 nickel-dependent lactate racemase [Candidatus Latescibacterota bacterium]